MRQRERGISTVRAVQILSLALMGQAALFYGLSRAEAIPQKAPLSALPRAAGLWNMVQEQEVEQEVRDVLRADELLSRTYQLGSTPTFAQLFVAYFATQRTGQAPHSPKNCLPGNGWIASESAIVTVPIEGREPIEVNRYVVARGDVKAVVMYWYQSRDRAVASEYKAKFYVVADAMRYNRSDTALIRVVVPVNGDEKDALVTATRFVQDIYKPVRAHLPA